MNGKEDLNLKSIRERLAGARGREWWRSLEELAETEEFQELLRHEFPREAPAWEDPISRRRFLTLMGASLALAGLGACGSPSPTNEKIVPYVRAPEEIVPGKPLFFATAFSLGGIANGVLVESHEGRPTKIEGNPEHPASLGATDAFAQASVLTLYDPDRSQVVTHLSQISTWNAFYGAVNDAVEAQRLNRGAGLRVLTETVTSPTLAHQMRTLLAKFPLARWHQYDPVNRDSARAGARLALGQDCNTLYRFDHADLILALDSDFLFCAPGSVRYARDFAARRRVGGKKTEMNRLYVMESTPSVTGAMADHRLAVRAGEIEGLARAVAREIGVKIEPSGGGALTSARAGWIAALARDLNRHRGSSIVVAGDQQPPMVHALAHAMNHVLGNVATTVIYTDPVEANPADQTESLRALVRDMQAGRVDLLIVIGGNPVFTAPADLDFARQLSNVKLRVHLSLYEDETSALCHWHIPEAHYLESWSDARAYDGTVAIIQPLIAPLYGGKSAHELLAALMGQPDRSGYDIVRDYWKSRNVAADFEGFWRRALHDGLIAGTALPAKPLKLKGVPNLDRTSGSETQSSKLKTQNSFEIVFRPDPTIFDGRFANNGWLQELPKPLTKLTWDNAALISPGTAERLGLQNGDVVELRYLGRSLRAPVWIAPGHAADSVTVHLGYGRTKAGKIGTALGFNAYALRSEKTPWFGEGLELLKTGRRSQLASTQRHHNMNGRNLVRVGTIEEYLQQPNFAQETESERSASISLYPGFKHEGYAWGMAIDLNACIGCNACVVACQAENNIPVVGKNEVARGREMHWIRIDRYYRGNLDSPETYHQPVLCMHCENAPCELVCPVAATVHSPEGLNEMVYNRCVGTRYCSNNCPYKVRRFNFLQYPDYETPSLKLLRNPNVTVRSRGVMEKCTYCVQRINAARIQTEKENREIRDGEIVTACQAACPTQAIIFGNINDRESRVSKLKAGPRNYGLLTELNTQPRTTYLARLRNPNPEIEVEQPRQG
ncbi:MAG: TAT-variant-translocated molybdopterin oxidoreductase [Acidobacteria bacterium]|nr:TAT-variant-translocated molybdopterin oxidoreductase [Acidobacteriota bacterium]